MRSAMFTTVKPRMQLPGRVDSGFIRASPTVDLRHLGHTGFSGRRELRFSYVIHA